MRKFLDKKYDKEGNNVQTILSSFMLCENIINGRYKWTPWDIIIFPLHLKLLMLNKNFCKPTLLLIKTMFQQILFPSKFSLVFIISTLESSQLYKIFTRKKLKSVDKTCHILSLFRILCKSFKLQINGSPFICLTDIKTYAFDFSLWALSSLSLDVPSCIFYWLYFQGSQVQYLAIYFQWSKCI